MKDTLWRGTAFADTFRVFAVDATQTAQTARDQHDLSPLATTLMGKMIAATAILSLDLKHPDGELSMRVDGDGELDGGLVICKANGDIRGYIRQPHLQASDPQDNFMPGKMLGNGTLSVIKSTPGVQPWMGSTSLETGEIAEDLAHFYLQSEQIPSAVALGILMDKDARIRACGGFVIQQLPFANPSKAEALIKNLGLTPNLSDLMDMGMSIKDVFDRFVFKDIDYQIAPAHNIQYRCNCSKERFARSLLTLGKEELEKMMDGIRPQCHYCNASYDFAPEDIKALLDSLEA